MKQPVQRGSGQMDKLLLDQSIDRLTVDKRFSQNVELSFKFTQLIPALKRINF